MATYQVMYVVCTIAGLCAGWLANRVSHRRKATRSAVAALELLNVTLLSDTVPAVLPDGPTRIYTPLMFFGHDAKAQPLREGLRNGNLSASAITMADEHYRLCVIVRLRYDWDVDVSLVAEGRAVPTSRDPAEMHNATLEATFNALNNLTMQLRAAY